jgi:hypothetical protein
MKYGLLLVGFVALAACNAGGGTGPATYRVEFSGSVNQGGFFQGAYASRSGGEIFANALPASKEFTATTGEYVAGDGKLGGGGTLTAKIFKNNVLCEEKTLNITDVGGVVVACNRP